MRLRDLKQVELVQKTGINKATLSQYISGKYEPKQNRIYALAKALNVSEAWLMGFDVPLTRGSNFLEAATKKEKFDYDNFMKEATFF